MAYPDTVGELDEVMGTVPPATPGAGTVKLSKEEVAGLVMDNRAGQGPNMPVTNDHTDDDTTTILVQKNNVAGNFPGPNVRSSTVAEQAEQAKAKSNSPNIP